VTELSFSLDGQPVTVDVDPTTPLRDVLRDSLGARGVKAACDSGRCGVCTVHLDGEAVKSCLVVAGKADGREVTTVAGVGDSEDGLTDLQQAFVDNFAAQCGYCTPGFVMTASAYLERAAPDDDRETIRSELEGNVCRCTGYHRIVDAVEDVLPSEE
jgi:aerobic-type carbon monoxide dehydrogenase small subunit (CoxS/CutS family)